MTKDDLYSLMSPEELYLNQILEGSELTGTSDPLFLRTFERNYSHALRLVKSLQSVLNSYPDLPETYIQRLHNAIFRVYQSDGDSQRREAEIEFNNILGDVIQKQESELSFERQQPSFVLSELLATGMSPTAARMLLSGAQYNPAVTEQNALSAPDSGLAALEGISKGVSSVVSIFSLAGSLAQLGADMALIDAQAKATSAGANFQSYMNEGLQTATAFNQVCEAARKTNDYSPDITSVSDYISLIEKLGSDGDDTIYYDFIENYVKTGKMSNPFALQYAKDNNQLLIDNNIYARKLFNDLRLQELDIDSIESEISLNQEQISNAIINRLQTLTNIQYITDYQFPIAEQELSNLKKQGYNIDADTISKNIANRAAKVALEYSQRVMPLQADLDVENIQAALSVLNQTVTYGGEQTSLVVATLLGEQKTRYNLSLLSTLVSREQYRAINNSPKLKKLIGELSSDYVQNALRTYVLQNEARSGTITTGSERTVFGKKTSHTDTEALDAASYILFNIQQDKAWYDNFFGPRGQ